MENKRTYIKAFGRCRQIIQKDGLEYSPCFSIIKKDSSERVVLMIGESLVPKAYKFNNINELLQGLREFMIEWGTNDFEFLTFDKDYGNEFHSYVCGVMVMGGDIDERVRFYWNEQGNL